MLLLSASFRSPSQLHQHVASTATSFKTRHSFEAKHQSALVHKVQIVWVLKRDLHAGKQAQKFPPASRQPGVEDPTKPTMLNHSSYSFSVTPHIPAPNDFSPIPHTHTHTHRGNPWCIPPAEPQFRFPLRVIFNSNYIVDAGESVQAQLLPHFCCLLPLLLQGRGGGKRKGKKNSPWKLNIYTPT